MLTHAHFRPPLWSGPSSILHLLAAFRALDLGPVSLIPAVPLSLGTVSPWTDSGDPAPPPHHPTISQPSELPVYELSWTPQPGVPRTIPPKYSDET